ncbi:GNAT family N-acetyltransferase [Rapidithrix thailandica]|uniref:GNAT family N-acetyltransferase n=1 Tax=Rapidithrix thailandica TaxID=413964 RepID=A0AAW9RVL5_9BACT
MDLQTEIAISRIQEKDAFAFWTMIEKNKEHIQTYFPKTLNQLYDLASTEEFVRSKIEEYETRKGVYFSLKKGGMMIGMVHVKNIDWIIPKGEIAYFIDKDHQGYGIISYAVSWLVNYCFTEMKLEKIYARVSPGNLGSKKTLIKNGFRQEGLLRKDYRDGKGNLTDTEYYGKVKES